MQRAVDERSESTELQGYRPVNALLNKFHAVEFFSRVNEGRRPAVHRLATIAVAATLACGSGSGPSDEDLGGLVKRRKVAVVPVDVAAAATDPAELRRALMQPHSRIAGGLGAHSFRGTSKLRVTAGDEVVRSLDDETAIDYAANGDFRAILDNSREYGRHALFVDGTLYLRPRFGKYHQRPPTSDDEPAGIRDDIYATLGDYFDLVSAAAAPDDLGSVTADGRSGRKIELVMSDSPLQRTETASQKQWREQAEVLTVKGFVVLDDATGAVLDGALQGEVVFTQEGTTYTLSVEVTHKVTVTSTVEVAAPPEDKTVATRMRPHDLEQRDQLLEGIAPPLRKTPVPP